MLFLTPLLSLSGNYLAKYLSGDNGNAALDEKKRQDKALEVYQAAMAKYTRDRTKLLDWIQTNREIKEQANQNFTNTDHAFKLYNQAHPDKQVTPPKEPRFADFYQPSELQKQAEIVLTGIGLTNLPLATKGPVISSTNCSRKDRIWRRNPSENNFGK